MDGKKVNIIGTEYTIKEDENLAKTDRDGECRVYAKEIYVRKTEDLLDDIANDELKEIRKAEVLRHELWHAVFFESGLEDYCDNEQLVDFLAKQSPKTFKIFQELGIL